MKDIIHIPSLHNDEWKCEECGIHIPHEIILAAPGEDVIEIGGGLGFVPYDGTLGAIKCSHPSAKIEHERADQIYEAEELEPEEPELEPGEKVKEARPVSDMERMVTNARFQNFLQMREATRLQE